ncbi:MAG: bacillithiol biosynthesis BshC [Gemmatimonadota bacterium]|nr:bacillithiol biosynthesis BshC [Gemmatimonadota bacterium]MDQ8146453.1 bacillithiol biosynthesis BshC [Gemmatimonadota bacterium]MDQ8148380.1 bacillithiol biosynthesis BshC [Gemmatimonadota bacterium]MDQ8156186.1 bacillithiol biosynthesis BshC [Gemmatimonadota bacterium]MDQ8176171.1 bacillithiol biosynthesis BshC [Gemmatimonadota bacterium]
MSAPRVLTESFGGGPLVRAILQGVTPPEWVVPRPRGVEGWRAQVASVRDQAPVGWRETLAPAFAASGEAAARLDRVAAAGGVVVTTGQQPGLFGGPLYTLLKALSALALADRLERETGISAAPVFWAATDDADFAEAAWTGVAEAEGFQRLAIARQGADGVVMAEMPLGEVDAVYARLVLAAGSAPNAALLDAVRAAYAPGATIGGAYVALMRSLLEPLGIAVLDAWHPAVRAAARPTLLAALRGANRVDEALSLRTVAIERAGFRAQVARVARLSLVFESHAGAKLRVPLARAAALAVDDAATLSPNVLLRPIVERQLLPTVAYVGGPGELGYFAQVTAVADALDLPRPLAVPRWSATIVEPTIDRRLGRLGLTVADLLDPHAAERQLGERALPQEARVALEGLRTDISARMVGLRTPDGESPALVPDRVLEGARLQLEHRVARLERRLRAAAYRRDEALGRDMLAVRAALRPEQQRQERRLSAIPFLARHGDLLVTQLKAGAALHAGTLLAP